MTNQIVRFKANASVKDIVGRGLIYDDNIAIIELVKNAKDAGSPTVSIEFQDEIHLSSRSSLIIADTGKGMTLDDIRDKWLNIAYSEKKGQLLGGKDSYAGNKGVGRFSCDRLGKQLTLYTKARGGDYIKLPINWELFEGKGQNDQISDIALEYHILDEEEFLNDIGEDEFLHGTVLQINQLRSEWSSKKLSKLVSELEKFSPSLDDGFEVYLYTNSLHKEKRLKDKLNKKINNNVLDKLAFKTTYIKSRIDSEGSSIYTTLYYQGEEVYTYHAENPYAHLKGITVEIHFLDPLSKTYFTKNVGISPNIYGSIFLFYNGFRVSPYGNSKNDWLGLDQRKSQGTARYLGTREVMGRIDIKDHDETFSVITSREGLVHNKAFAELVAFDPEEKTTFKDGKDGYGYITTIIRQLENFVVSGLDWNSLIDRLNPERRTISDTEIIKDPSRYHLRPISEDKIREACNRILKSNLELTDFKINEDLILSLAQIAEDKYRDFVAEFVSLSGNKALEDLTSKEKSLVSQIVAQEQEKTKAALEERAYAEEQRQIAEEREEVQERRANFLESLESPEKTLDALITHVMKQLSGVIEKDIKYVLGTYYRTPERVSKERLVEVLESVATDIAMIKETATMATKADFNLKVASIETGIYGFLEEYIREIASKQRKWGLKIHFSNTSDSEIIKSFEPAKLCVFFVNILDNARKFQVRNLFVKCSPNGMSFIDDGPGFDFNKYSQEDYFRKGITTTEDGSGLGLYHCKKIAEEELGAVISLTNDGGTKGASINLEFR